jgi:hypothetical protein
MEAQDYVEATANAERVLYKYPGVGSELTSTTYLRLSHLASRCIPGSTAEPRSVPPHIPYFLLHGPLHFSYLRFDCVFF